MKKVLLLAILFCQLFIISCHKNQTDEINGDMTPIKFTSDNLTFVEVDDSDYITNISMDGGEYMMETINYPWWTISAVYEKKDEDSKTIFFKEFADEYESDWYSLKIPSNKKTQLNILIDSNPSKNSRKLKIDITCGAILTFITIIQAGNN